MKQPAELANDIRRFVRGEHPWQNPEFVAAITALQADDCIISREPPRMVQVSERWLMSLAQYLDTLQGPIYKYECVHCYAKRKSDSYVAYRPICDIRDNHYPDQPCAYCGELTEWTSHERTSDTL